mmetsp:Transcript_88762/g.267039  ORF Transcript_88762/g.267039 Transcript_88762/m.267039 type:complete len:233 (+) Transcript_88762:1183-1881(+)
MLDEVDDVRGVGELFDALDARPQQIRREDCRRIPHVHLALRCVARNTRQEEHQVTQQLGVADGKPLQQALQLGDVRFWRRRPHRHSGADELVIQLKRQDGLRQLAEKHLEQPRDRVQIVALGELGLDVDAVVDGLAHFAHLRRVARHSEDALGAQALVAVGAQPGHQHAHDLGHRSLGVAALQHGLQLAAENAAGRRLAGAAARIVVQDPSPDELLWRLPAGQPTREEAFDC